MPKPYLRRSSFWTLASVNDEKRKVKEELSLARDKDKIKLGLQKLQEAEDRDDPKSQVRSFVLIISILLQQYRTPKLNPKQVERLIEKAYALLKVQELNQRSRLSFLFGEIQQAISLIAWKEGDVWRSAWEQQVGAHLSGSNTVGGKRGRRRQRLVSV